jgi:hypothetical protein
LGQDQKFIQNFMCGEEEKLPPTWGFVQAGLDVQTSTFCIAVLWFGLDGILLGF